MKGKIKSSYFIFFWIIYLELIYKVFIIGDLFYTNTLLTIIFASAWAGGFSLICNLSKNQKLNKILTSVILIFFSVLFLAQIVYFKFLW